MADATFYRVIIRSAPKGYGGPSHGMSYDLSTGCPQCGTATAQIGALQLARSELPAKRPIHLTLDGEFLVHEDVLARFDSLLGLELRQARGLDGDALPWFQAIPASTMPRLAARRQNGAVRRGGCRACRRDGFFDRPGQSLVYEAEAIGSDPPPIAFTWECFGLSRLREPMNESHFAHPALIVRTKWATALDLPAVELVPVHVR